ncbi:MAG: hypothetical protein ACAH88_08700 [Roseimicrobium sp.]
MSLRLLRAAFLAGLIIVVVIAVYLAAQWNASDPLTFRVIGVTRSGEHTSTLRLEIRNSSAFTIKMIDAGGVERWPITWFYTSGPPTIYAFRPADPSRRIITLKPGQTIERGLIGRGGVGAFDGGLTYSWEPNSKEALRRIERLAEKWHLKKAPATPIFDMRTSGAGPVLIPAPK